jgi:hypothetical protein
VRRRVRSLGYRSWHGGVPGAAVEVVDPDDPAVMVTTRDVPLDEVTALRMALIDAPLRGYLALTVRPAHQDGHMVDTGIGCYWFVVTATEATL